MSVFNWVALIRLIESPIGRRSAAFIRSTRQVFATRVLSPRCHSKDAEWLLNGVRSTDAE